MNVKEILVSVIVPVYNAENHITKTVKSLLNQKKINFNYEIVVVDDGSTDNTYNIIEQFAEKYSNIKLIKQNNTGPAEARNNGVKNAEGKIIMFTDSDCEPDLKWIYNMYKPFKNGKDIVGVKGVYKTKQNKLIARFVQYEYEFKYKKMKKFKEIDFIDTYSAGFFRDKFLEFDGYDTEFPVACAEDVELSFRMKQKHYKMIFVPDAYVYHIHPDSITKYFKKKFKFAFWRMKVVKMHPEFFISDSHTPQSMKIQIVLLPMVFLSFLLMLFLETDIIFIILFIAYLLSILNFYKFLIKKNKIFIITAPFYIAVRNVAQFCGILNYIFKN